MTNLLLQNQDKLLFFCYGRPSAINMQDTDVRLPTMDDFPVSHPDNNIFIQKSKLCMILGRLAQMRQNPSTSYSDLAVLGESFEEWCADLPEELKLREEYHSQPHRRIVSELHILYHASYIIYLQALTKLDTEVHSTRAAFEQCVRRSSRMTRLFEAILYRNEVAYIRPINNWFCLVAGLIQIRALATFTEDRALYNDELTIIKTVLQDMIPSSASAALVLRNLQHCETSVGTVSKPARSTSNHTTTNDPLNLSMDDHREGGIDPLFPSQDHSDMNLRPDLAPRLPNMGPNGIDEYFLVDSFDLAFGNLQSSPCMLEDWSLS